MTGSAGRSLIGALLALCVALGTPLHCLAEGLHKSAPKAAMADDSGPGYRGLENRPGSHCSSHVALLPVAGGATAYLGQTLPAADSTGPSPRSSEVIFQTRFVVRDIGPPDSSSSFARRSLPLLV